MLGREELEWSRRLRTVRPMEEIGTLQGGPSESCLGRCSTTLYRDCHCIRRERQACEDCWRHEGLMLYLCIVGFCVRRGNLSAPVCHKPASVNQVAAVHLIHGLAGPGMSQLLKTNPTHRMDA